MVEGVEVKQPLAILEAGNWYPRANDDQWAMSTGPRPLYGHRPIVVPMTATQQIIHDYLESDWKWSVGTPRSKYGEFDQTTAIYSAE